MIQGRRMRGAPILLVDPDWLNHCSVLCCRTQVLSCPGRAPGIATGVQRLYSIKDVLSSLACLEALAAFDWATYALIGGL